MEGMRVRGALIAVLAVGILATPVGASAATFYVDDKPQWWSVKVS